jgi:hypothetical protein
VHASAEQADAAVRVPKHAARARRVTHVKQPARSALEDVAKHVFHVAAVVAQVLAAAALEVRARLLAALVGAQAARRAVDVHGCCCCCCCWWRRVASL